MQANDTLAGMAFSRAIAEQKVRGAEQTINEHIAKLLAFDADPALRESWKRELVRKHFRFFARMRLKPGNRAIRAGHFWDWLYADPFVGNELSYTDALIALSEDEHFPRNSRPVADIAAEIAVFHRALAAALAGGDDGEALVQAL